MDRFIRNENMKLWRRHLAETADPQERDVLLNLIREEELREIAHGVGQPKTSDRNGGNA
jgi:hypothetical protein